MSRPEERLRDGQGRAVRYLRVSVTDRCNLRCRYCMPEDGVDWMDHSALLSYEQIARLVGLFARLGVEKVRLTGGEPLVRRDLHRLAAAVSGTPGIREVAVTTNGILLAEQLPGLVEAGLTGVNMSLDTLDRAQFAAITRRDQLTAALAGLEAALTVPGLKVKLNCVLMGENDGQLVPLAALARDRDLSVRFIELMPIGLGSGFPHRTEAEVLERLEAAFGPARSCPQDEGGGPGRYITFDGFRGRIGFISAMTHRFCDRCNRVRLTSAGFLKTCLQYDRGVALKPLLDAGAGDDDILTAIRRAVEGKPAGHHFTGPAGPGDEGRNMSQIGG